MARPSTARVEIKMIRPKCAAFIAGRFACTREIAAHDMQIGECHQIGGVHVLERLFTNRSGAMHDGGRRRLGRDLESGRSGRIGIREIHQDRANAVGAQRAWAPRQTDDLIALLE